MAKQRSRRSRAPAKKAKPAPERAQARQASSTRNERLQAQRRAKQRRSTLTRLAVLGAAVLAIASIVLWQINSRRNAQRTIAAITTGTCKYDTKTDPGRVNEHAPRPTFKVIPPGGGVHSPSASRAGAYTVENAPDDGQVVHSLEHGYIAISYRPELAAGDLSALREIADAHEDDVLLLPRAGLDVAVAATAWHRRLLCGTPEPASVRRFVEAYKGKGPENQPRG